MQSHGIPGTIQITRPTYDELLKDEFTCEPRGNVMIKAKGEMEAWLLGGSESAAEPRGMEQRSAAQ